MPLEDSNNTNIKIKGKNTHGNSLNKDLPIKALNNISDLEAIYHSVNKNGQPKKHDYIVVVGVKDKLNNEIMVALHLNKLDSGYEINQIFSVYGKNNIDNYIRNKVRKYQVYSKFGQKNLQ